MESTVEDNTSNRKRLEGCSPCVNIRIDREYLFRFLLEKGTCDECSDIWVLQPIQQEEQQ